MLSSKGNCRNTNRGAACHQIGLVTAAAAAYLMYGIVDHFERRLFVVVIHAAVAVEDGHAVLLRPPTVAPVHAVIGPVVPLAGKDEETLWRVNTHMYLTVSNRGRANSLVVAAGGMRAELRVPGLSWKMMLRRSWSPQVMWFLYFW